LGIFFADVGVSYRYVVVGFVVVICFVAMGALGMGVF
jgi:hypothetical protein